MTNIDRDSSVFTKQERDRLRTVISVSTVRPFLVTLRRGSGTWLDVHVSKEALKASAHATNTSLYVMRRDFSRQISALGLELSIRIKLHSGFALDKPRSLEAFVARFGPGGRLYDPTGAFDEADRLVRFACGLRRHLQGALKGVYWNSRWRTIYALLDERALVDADGYCLRRDKLFAAEQSVIEAHQTTAEADISRNVRLCLSLPALPLVPIDEASFAPEFAEGPDISKLRRLLQLPALARVSIFSALLGIGSAGVAVAKLPSVENRPMLIGSDTVSAAPAAFGNRNVGDRDNAVFPGGPGLHWLWRDPVQGAVGQNATMDQASVGTEFLGPKTTLLVNNEDRISRDRFFDVSRFGGTFGSSSTVTDENKLDLGWLAPGESTATSGPNVSTDRAPSGEHAAMQPGVAAVFGLSSLMGGRPSAETYGAVLRDAEIHFGLPRSLQAEALWHFSSAANSALPSGPDRKPFEREVLMAEGQSFWEWMQVGPKDSPNDGRNYPNNQTHRQNPCRSSSC